MNTHNNIVLIGMPAVGKSTVGLILARTLNYNFLDTDTFIQEQEGTALSDIIDKKGINGFCRIEETHVLSIQANHTVISTGGSVVYGKRAMEHLKANGCIVYLTADISLLMSRLSDPEKRGVIRKPGQTLESLLAERDRLYKSYADIVVICPEGDIPEVTASRVLVSLDVLHG
ncbi:MAG: shikimate kinase [Proteobacteria bacterium]|nr:shikimate kinase [Pseudomonadota bacterium]